MTDELQAALARAEAAEAEMKRLEALELARVNANQRAERAERQRDEAWAKGAGAMRTTAAEKANDMGDWSIHEAILALPIPAQEVK